jgi:hypothetical protein
MWFGALTRKACPTYPPSSSFISRRGSVFGVRHEGITADKSSRIETAAPALESGELSSALVALPRWWPHLQGMHRYLTPTVLMIYAAAMGVAILHHEPWVDEAQAWLLARDASPVTLISKLLAYEGHPALWYVVLMLPARLFPYRVLNLVSGALAGFAAYLLVRRSPFPVIARVLLPFTFFLFFQYGVVARNYALLPGILFLLAIAYRERVSKPLKFAGLLFLLANVSAHGFLMAAAIAAVTFFGVARGRSALPEALLKRNLVALAALQAGMVLLALLMWPPADRDFSRPRTGPFLGRVVNATVEMYSDAFAGSKVLLVIVLVASLVLFWRAGVVWLWLLPAAAIIVFSEQVYGSPWHEGTLFTGWIFALWVGLDHFTRTEPVDIWIRRLVLTTLVVVSAIQASWTIAAVRADFAGSYSGSKALAQHIKERSLDRSVIYGIGYPTLAVLPYFERNIYDNYHAGKKPSYWDWSSRNDMIVDPAEIERRQPDYVVVPVKATGADAVLNRFPSYRQDSVFHGSLYWKGAALEPDTYVLLRRGDLLRPE